MTKQEKITAAEFFREKIKENHQVPKDFSLWKIDWLNGEETMRWAHEYAKKIEEQFLSKLDSHIDYLNEKASKEKGELKKSYEDSVNSFVIFKMKLKNEL